MKTFRRRGKPPRKLEVVTLTMVITVQNLRKTFKCRARARRLDRNHRKDLRKNLLNRLAPPIEEQKILMETFDIWVVVTDYLNNQKNLEKVNQDYLGLLFY